MSLFFDTNVLIAYIFKWDPWYSYAKNTFKETSNSYFSDTVDEEVSKKFQELLKKYVCFLDLLIRKLQQFKGFLTKKDLLRIANLINVKKINKLKIIESIWDDEGFNFDENCEFIVSTLKEIKSDFKQDSFSRKTNFVSMLELHIRNREHPNIERELKKKIHFPDWKIFLDAYDLFIYKEPNLEVVTSDAKPENIEYILKITKLPKITDLASRVFK
ncbi:MAG: hypothetical protein FWH29_05345 [Methanobrevibacter sp.]|nr:hypothetical protein [Methanobrevibacter sp.]